MSCYPDRGEATRAEIKVLIEERGDEEVEVSTLIAQIKAKKTDKGTAEGMDADKHTLSDIN